MSDTDYFSHGLPVPCPDCGDPGIELLHRNFGGCSIDIGVCDSCGHGFDVAYTVRDIDRNRTYDRLPAVQRWDQEAKQRRDEKEAKDREERELYEKLKQKFESE
jgi:hypothetical protein